MKQREFFMGIDPGKDGAAVAISDDLICLHDWITPQEAIRWMNKVLLWGNIKLSVLEDVNPRKMPPKGRFSAFDLGTYTGYWQMLCACHGIDCRLIDPKQWKAATIKPVPGERQNIKHKSLIAARLIDPSLANSLTRVKDHNRAEAALMAVYAKMIYDMENRIIHKQ